MNIKTNGSPRDYAKEQPEQLEPSDAARRTIAALGYGLRVSNTGDAWALEHNGFLHSDWMTIRQVEAFAAGVDMTLWILGLDEAAYHVADREETTYKTEVPDKAYKTEVTDGTYKAEAADKTDKYDGPCDHCDRCKADTEAVEHDVNTVPDSGDFERVEIDGQWYVPERTCRMGLGKLHYEWVCLACGKHYHWHEIRHAKYCPDCGAKIENEGWGDAD